MFLQINTREADQAAAHQAEKSLSRQGESARLMLGDAPQDARLAQVQTALLSSQATLKWMNKGVVMETLTQRPPCLICTCMDGRTHTH